MRFNFLATCGLMAWAALSGFHDEATAVHADKDDPKERTELEGTWQGFVVIGAGEKPNEGPVKLEVVVTGNKMTAKDLRENKSLGEGTFKLDATKKLKEIDATGSVSQGRSRTYAGIYEIDGDTLKWCVDNVNQGRPTEFVTKRGQYLLILKRQKP